jgi:hypothetical protein
MMRIDVGENYNAVVESNDVPEYCEGASSLQGTLWGFVKRISGLDVAKRGRALPLGHIHNENPQVITSPPQPSGVWESRVRELTPTSRVSHWS